MASRGLQGGDGEKWSNWPEDDYLNERSWTFFRDYRFLCANCGRMLTRHQKIWWRFLLNHFYERIFIAKMKKTIVIDGFF